MPELEARPSGGWFDARKNLQPRIDAYFVALTVAGCLMTAGAVLALGRLLSDDDGVAIGMPGSGGQPASSAQHRAKSAKKAEFAAMVRLADADKVDRIGL